MMERGYAETSTLARETSVWWQRKRLSPSAEENDTFRGETRAVIADQYAVSLVSSPVWFVNFFSFLAKSVAR